MCSDVPTLESVRFRTLEQPDGLHFPAKRRLGYGKGWEHAVAARYHFDLENGPELIQDQEGAEASGLEEAVTHALAVIGEMRASGEIAELGRWTLAIRNGEGTVLKRIPVE